MDMNKIVASVFVLGFLYVAWYFVVYLPTVDSCNSREGMAVYAVYPLGAKCTSYEEAFRHWNPDLEYTDEGHVILKPGQSISL